tara:strand:+ start:478 stop:630 length:153 start_codon:yes stop_codon:yes gene_type:complete
MPTLLGIIIKTIFTEKMIKTLLVALGDYLVKSSKNKLDDKLWKSVRGKLG